MSLRRKIGYAIVGTVLVATAVLAFSEQNFFNVLISEIKPRFEFYWEALRVAVPFCH
jgi:hypothetical protein